MIIFLVLLQVLVYFTFNISSSGLVLIQPLLTVETVDKSILPLNISYLPTLFSSPLLDNYMGSLYYDLTNPYGCNPYMNPYSNNFILIQRNDICSSENQIKNIINTGAKGVIFVSCKDYEYDSNSTIINGINTNFTCFPIRSSFQLNINSTSFTPFNLVSLVIDYTPGIQLINYFLNNPSSPSGSMSLFILGSGPLISSFQSVAITDFMQSASQTTTMDTMIGANCWSGFPNTVSWNNYLMNSTNLDICTSGLCGIWCVSGSITVLHSSYLRIQLPLPASFIYLNTSLSYFNLSSINGVASDGITEAMFQPLSAFNQLAILDLSNMINGEEDDVFPANYPLSSLETNVNLQYISTAGTNFATYDMSDGFSQLIKLQYLNIRNSNILSNGFPNTLAALIALEYINFAGNYLSGTPPDALYSLPQLRVIYFDGVYLIQENLIFD